ncbi:hypothetical protein [Chthonobacter rhizosphaerae]|uniref:hypothetical protein n=1 Tax=Chthonobacter rhizosphaerae TaxID=2735553 RepID=UPI0015EEE745|nr:hypothetical protein [Chthonobacter rhizosphaerae]
MAVSTDQQIAFWALLLTAFNTTASAVDQIFVAHPITQLEYRIAALELAVRKSID